MYHWVLTIIHIHTLLIPAAPGDYTSLTSFSVIFLSTGSGVEQFSVTINPDMILEGDQAFSVDLVASSLAYTIGTVSSFTVTINDDDGKL